MLRTTLPVVLATSWLALGASTAPAAWVQPVGPTIRVGSGTMPDPGRWVRNLMLDRLTIPLGHAGPNGARPSGTGTGSEL